MTTHPSTVLIPFVSRYVGSETVPTVDGQDMYAFLEITKPYSPWIRTQIKRLKLVENRDYLVYYPEVKNPKGGRPPLEYHFTFDAAKHIGMISGMTKGHEVREYFIAKEKEFQAVQPASLLDQYPELKAISQLALSTAEARHIADEARQLAQAAEVRAVRAETKADQIAQHQQWVTVRQYVALYQLERQLPLGRLQQAYGTWLARYCQEHGWPVYQLTSVDTRWPTENQYPRWAIEQTLQGWLSRRRGDEPLRLVDTGGQ